MVIFVYNTLRPALPQKAFGMVEGVIFAEDEPSALIDGQVVREGQKIYGVNVACISSNKVEFECGGQRWEQSVRERPNPGWEESEQVKEHSEAIY